MEGKELFDARIELAKFHRLRWSARQEQEWKLSLALWAVLAAATYYVKSTILPIWFGLPIIVAHAYFLYALRISNHTDAWRVFYWVRQAETLAGGSISAPDGKPSWEWKDWKNVLGGAYSFWCQVLMTTLLVAASYSYIVAAAK